MNDEIPSNPTRPESILTGIKQRASKSLDWSLGNTCFDDRQWLLDAYERQRRQLRVLRKQVKALSIGASVRAARSAK
jgi:hypothetical protein